MRAKDRVGHVQVRFRRALIAAKGAPVCIGDFLPRCFPRAKTYTRWMRNSVHRALPRFAVSLGRTNTRGRPNLWIPNPELMRRIKGTAAG
jgi:hypothetical protein